jgi:chromosome segregation ATPase
MADNPIETLANELKKWLELLEKLLNKMESDKQAQGSAKLTAERHAEQMQALKDLKNEIAKHPDSPEAKTALKKIDAATDKLNEINPNLKADAPKLGEHRRRVGDDLKGDGFSKDAQGWKKGETHVKGASQKVSAPAASIKMPGK